MVFAALVIERPPLEWSGLTDAVGQWLQDAGLYAFVWLVLLALSYALVPEFRHRSRWGWLHNTMTGLALAGVALLVVFLVLLARQGRVQAENLPRPTDVTLKTNQTVMVYTSQQKLFLSLAGLCALAACSVPLVRDLFQKRIIPRRIWAIARVSIKEAWSRGIVWVCLIIPLIYLYADWFISAKADDQLRSRIGIAYFSISVLFVLTAALLGAFSIPADIRSQNIFTVVTKPVERYEIVLGRFLGYAVLLFAELVVLTSISWVYVYRGATPQAMEESYHARVPLFGRELFYHNTSKRTEAQNVGREWDYRSYITGRPPGTNKAIQYAVWTFDDIPAVLADPTKDVRIEFSFDIFRTTTGQENKDVLCRFTIASGQLTPDQVDKIVKPQGEFENKLNKVLDEAKQTNQKRFSQLVEEAKQKNQPAPSRAVLDKWNAESKEKIEWDLRKEFGVYQIKNQGVTDYHTQFLTVPGRMFEILREQAPGPDDKDSDGKPKPKMQVYVNVENDFASWQQLVGMAKPDLYFLVADEPFFLNFFKGALCIYMIACLVLGVAVVGSTYFSGIVSLLLTALICVGGLFKTFVESVAEGRSEGGGPLEAFYRLANRTVTAVPLDRGNTVVDVLFRGDAVYRSWLRLVLKLIPDVSDYYPKDYVANGFDIGNSLLLLNFILPVAAYLLPWSILAYYLIKSREIANP
jgi:hypothetical protein